MQIGTRLGAYEVIASLGEGGMGHVYRAHDARLGRDVALKVLPADVAADPERLARFRREARAVAALNHPHIVTIFSIEEEHGVPFITMELVEGRSFDQVLTGSGLPLAQSSSRSASRSPTRCQPLTEKASSIAT
jgi:eukaryotic-like serine/threonine-protein kinase